jgi:hypothetical protein
MSIWNGELRFIGHDYKNWLNDVKVGCSLANEDVMKFFAVEIDLLESHEVELIEVGMFEEG